LTDANRCWLHRDLRGLPSDQPGLHAGDARRLRRDFREPILGRSRVHRGEPHPGWGRRPAGELRNIRGVVRAIDRRLVLPGLPLLSLRQEDASMSLRIRPTGPDDATLLRSLARRCPPLDLHTPYTYWVQATYFGDTCFVAELGGE